MSSVPKKRKETESEPKNPKEPKVKQEPSSSEDSSTGGCFFSVDSPVKKPTKKKSKPTVASTDDDEVMGSSGVMAPISTVHSPNKFANLEDTSFWLKFNSPGPLIQMINIANDTLEIADFKVIKTAGFAGIQIISMDKNHVSLIRSHLECMMDKAPPMDQAISFRVKISTLKTLLSQVNSSSVLEWGCRKGSDKHLMYSYERDTGSYVRNFEIPLLTEEDADELPPLKAWDFSFVIEMEMGVFKEHIKVAKELKAATIKFQILEYPEPQSSVTIHYLILETVGETATSKCIFRSTSQSDGVQEDKDGNKIPVVIRTANTLEATQNAHSEFQKNEKLCQSKYCEEFPCEYLSNFVKSMMKTNISLQLESTRPLWLKYSLGPKSFMELICSPALSDSAE